MSCSSSLALTEEGCMAHTHKDHAGLGSRASCSAEAATGNKLETHPAYKSILFPAPHSLPFSSVRGTDVPRSQYRPDMVIFASIL
jgi:hypothetical protein